MNEQYYFDPNFVKLLYTRESEKEILEFIHSELHEVYGDNTPSKAVIKTYLTSEEYDSEALTEDMRDSIFVKVIEFAQSSLVMLRHLILFNMMKRNGSVDTLDEYMSLAYPDDKYYG